MFRARPASAVLAALLAAALAACYDPGLRPTPDDDDQPSTRSHATNAFVLDESELQHSGDGTLLSAMQARVSAMAVRHNRSECPEIELRGPGGMAHPTNPAVYVDGARATNTCVLDGMSVSDVHRVEIYPMGVTQRPGYEGVGGGLILVFTRDGSS